MKDGCDRYLCAILHYMYALIVFNSYVVFEVNGIFCKLRLIAFSHKFIRISSDIFP